MGLNVEGMKEQNDLDAWRPALSQSVRELAPACGGRTVLKILELCAGCKSVSTAVAKEARETFGIERVEVFSLDGKPGTDCTRCADILTYDCTRDEELCSSFLPRGEGRGCKVYLLRARQPPLRTVQFDGRCRGAAVAA